MIIVNVLVEYQSSAFIDYYKNSFCSYNPYGPEYIFPQVQYPELCQSFFLNLEVDFRLLLLAVAVVIIFLSFAECIQSSFFLL